VGRQAIDISIVLASTLNWFVSIFFLPLYLSPARSLASEQAALGSERTPMAEDTRDGDSTSSSQSSNKPKHDFPKSQVGKLWDAFGNPEEPINVMPGATFDPSRQKPKELTISESLSSISMKDFSTFHKKPCARDSLMIGMGAGFGIGGIRGIVGGKFLVHLLFVQIYEAYFIFSPLQD
jgi:hypothetical protein